MTMMRTIVHLVRYYRLWRDPGGASRFQAIRNAFKSERIVRSGSPLLVCYPVMLCA
jgi:hypothetical protein